MQVQYQHFTPLASSASCPKTGYSAQERERPFRWLLGINTKQFQLASGEDSQDIFSVSKAHKRKKERKMGQNRDAARLSRG